MNGTKNIITSSGCDPQASSMTNDTRMTVENMTILTATPAAQQSSGNSAESVDQTSAMLKDVLDSIAGPGRCMGAVLLQQQHFHSGTTGAAKTPLTASCHFVDRSSQHQPCFKHILIAVPPVSPSLWGPTPQRGHYVTSCKCAAKGYACPQAFKNVGQVGNVAVQIGMVQHRSSREITVGIPNGST